MAPGASDKLFLSLAPWLLLIIESVLVLAAIALAFWSQLKGRRPRNGSAFLPYEGAFARLARKKTLACILVGAATLFIRVALIPLWGVPAPMWHDEFSFLLAADTFAHGRATNPTHPMWIHFESFHIIQHPSYMSMYPPAQGLMLAAGQLMGHPWIGQLATTAMLCGFLCWMLQAWLPPRWALLGATLATLQVGILSYWMNSYFGTSLPALGGVLVLGALPRIRRRARLRDAVFMGLGLAILANTRPFEGFIFSLPIAVVMISWLVQQKTVPASAAFYGVVLPLIFILGIAGGGMCYYFWRVTGHPFVMPYQVDRETYAMAPYFVWQKPRPEPVYHHREMREFYVNWELRDYQRGRSVLGFLRRTRHKAFILWSFYLGPVFTLPFLASPWLFRDRRMRFPLILSVAVLVSILMETWTLDHYVAPALGLFYLLLMQCIRHLRVLRWQGRPIGHALARAIPLVCIAMIVLRVSAAASGTQIEPLWQRGNLKRNAVIAELQKIPGNHLVIVHYGPDHSPHVDWIANRADIDGSTVVWARDMGVAQNQEIVRYFKDRNAWWINADDPSSNLEPYGPAAPSN